MISIFKHTRLAAAAATAIILAGSATVGAAGSKPASASFKLFPNTAVLNCLAAPGHTPQATVTVNRGASADRLTLTVWNLKPDLDFDVFTVEKTPQLADGTANPNFGGNFGFAWYQSDLHTDLQGRGEITIKTVLLDQIFGFDASRGVAPVNTFNLGFWFNNVADVSQCGITATTPFNGEHQAGPLAMITRLNATTKLGPLCTDPKANSTGTFHCNP